MESTKTKKQQFLQRYIDTIFIMLGHECNLNCKYCLQHPLVHEQISHEINPDIYDFIEQVAHENDGPIKLQFFGGEATLFFNVVKTIVKEITNRKIDVHWALMSNGKLINQEMVDYFNEYNFSIGISYDGYTTKITRGYDPFEDPDHRALLFEIKNLWLSAVLSAYNSPRQICCAFQELDNEYFTIHGRHIFLNVDDIFDTGGLPGDLLTFNYDKVMRENAEMTKEFLKDFVSGNFPNEHYAVNTYIRSFYQPLTRFYTTDEYKQQQVLACCGNGLNVLNMGLDGTLFPCHNTSESCGTIYSNYFDYLKQLIEKDNTKKFYNTECKNCLALGYCHGGCKMVKKEARKKTYCKLKRAVSIPVLSLIQNFKIEDYVKDKP